MSRLRGLAAAASLARRRAASAPGRWAAAALAVALACGFAGTLTAGGVVAGDHAARRVLAGAPAADRHLLVTATGGASAAVDRAARAGIGAMGGGAVTRGVVLQPTRFGRRLVQLVAVTPLARWVRLTGGRLPRPGCDARRCEVLELAGRPAPRAVGRGLEVVGRALLRSAVPLGFTGAPQPGRHAPLLVLLAGDAAGLDALAATQNVFRVQSWTAPYPLTALHAWGLDAALGRLTAGAAALDRAPGGLQPQTPADDETSARAQARAAPGRLASATATGLTALLAFLALTAVALRRGLLAEDARLRRGGATAAQRATLAALEAAVPAAAGLLAGAGLAVAGAALRARAGGLSAGDVLAHGGGRLAAAVLATAAVAWLVIVVTARASPRAVRAGALLVLVGAGAALAGVLAPRGAGAGDPLPGLVIPLATLAAALAAGLLAPVALRAWAHAAGRRRPLERLAAVELARDPGPSALAIAAIAASVGLAVFALSYRSTLRDSQRAQAAHRVPLAATVVPGPSLRPPLRAATAAAWQQAAAGGTVAPVVRRPAFAVVGPGRAPVTLLGAPVAGTARLGAGPRMAGAVLAPSARDVSLRIRARGAAPDVNLAVRTPSGVVDDVALGRAGARSRTLHAALPPDARGGEVIAIALQPSQSELAVAGHQSAEGGTGDQLARGVAAIGALRAGGRALPIQGWSGHGAAGGPPGAVRYALGGSTAALVRAPAATDRRPLPVLADPATARATGPGGTLSLDVDGVDVPARVAGTVPRVATVPSGAPVVVANVAALSDALDARYPGAGEPRELWLGAPRDVPRGGWERALAARVRRLGLHVVLRSAVERDLRSEPVSREVLGSLTAAAALAALLAVLALAVAVRRALRDGGRGLLDLEAQGVEPARLRAMLRRQAVPLAITGSAAGALLAVALASLVVGAVRAAATGAPPDPPLLLVFPWGAALAAAAAVCAGALAAGALAAAPALREPTPLDTARSEPA